MNKSQRWVVAVGLAAIGSAAWAQEQGRVISVTPMVQQVAVPRQVCTTDQVAVQSGKSGAGAVVGALAGGGLGNAMGQGSGKTALTVLGLVGGAMLGNNIEGGGTQVQNVQRCTTQTFYENRPTAYNVVYEFNGKQYTVQMPNDPGPFVQLQVTPVGGSVQAPAAPPAAPVMQAPVYAPQSYANPPVMSPQVVYTSPTVVYTEAPVYYARPYYPPFATSINIGYSRGWYGGHYHHWR